MISSLRGRHAPGLHHDVSPVAFAALLSTLPLLQPDNYNVENCVHVWGPSANCLNDMPCGYTSLFDSLPVVACCEVPSIPAAGTQCTSCPAGFSNADAAGFCYAAGGAGNTWDGAATACRALHAGASLAGIYDATTAASVLAGRCNGLLPSQDFWIGLRDNQPGVAGHADRAGSYWRWLGSGSVSAWFQTNGSSFWWAGERE